MKHMLRHMLGDRGEGLTVDRPLMPAFWPIVLYQKERPDLSDEQTFRMIVRRIPLAVNEGDEGLP
jgi:hypothetical protein